MALKIFIGTSANYEDGDAELVYEYSLRKNSSSCLEINWMRLSNQEDSFWSNWNTKGWYTPFSAFRWAVPYLCNFEGRAIYTDVDMINFHDITELYETKLDNSVFGCKKGDRFGLYEPCVMIIDCEKAGEIIWDIKKLQKKKNSHEKMKQLILSNNSFCKAVDPSWNCFDGEDLPLNKIKQLHFTNMSTQPWKPSWYRGETRPHPRKDIVELFWDLKQEALDSGIPLKKLDRSEILYNFIGK